MAGWKWATEGGKELLGWAIRKGLCNIWKLFVCKKGWLLRIARQCKNKKLFYKTTTATIFHRTQINVQQPFLNTACYCELAAKQLIFETLQSCVWCAASLSHRFKSSPAISGKVVMPDTAGYMMLAGHFRRNLVSSGDLNRSLESRGSQTSGVLPVLFVQAKRIKSYSLAGSSEVLQTSIQHTQTTTSH